MKQYCTNCQSWRPIDDSLEIGACFRDNGLPLIRRFRFKHEIWSCWKVATGARPIYPVTVQLLEDPEPEPVQVEVKREPEGQVTKPYWYVRKLARAARMSRLVGA